LCEKLSSSAGKEDSLRQATQAAINASGWPERISQGEDFSGPNARVAADATDYHVRVQGIHAWLSSVARSRYLERGCQAELALVVAIDNF